MPVYPGYVLAVVAACSPASRSSGSRTAPRTSRPTVRPRLPHPRRAGRRRRTARSPRSRSGRSPTTATSTRPPTRRKFPAGLFNVITGSYDFPTRVRRGRRRLHEQAARRRRLPLLVPGDRGGPRDRADGRHPRPRHRHGPGRAPHEELHPAGAVPVPHADRLGLRLGQLPGALRRPWTSSATRACARSRSRSAPEGELMGIGISSFTEIVGRRAWRTTSTSSGSRCSTAARSGSTRPARDPAQLGVQTQGQGHETTFAQIIAEELGFPVADIKIEEGDTDTAPYGLGTYASRSTPVAGAATAIAARKVRDKARKLAAAPARGEPRRPRVDQRQVLRQGFARAVQDDPGDRLRRLHQPSPRGWRPGSRQSTTTTRRT